jgi:hypothetical protein
VKVTHRERDGDDGEFALQVVAGFVLAVSFAGVCETLRGTGFVEDLEKRGVDPYADPSP